MLQQCKHYAAAHCACMMTAILTWKTWELTGTDLRRVKGRRFEHLLKLCCCIISLTQLIGLSQQGMEFSWVTSLIQMRPQLLPQRPEQQIQMGVWRWARQDKPFPCPLRSNNIMPPSVPISRFTPTAAHQSQQWLTHIHSNWNLTFVWHHLFSEPPMSRLAQRTKS